MSEKCEKCDHVMQIGDYPFCPHDNVHGALHMGEEPMEPYWDENLGPEPVYITTRGQRRAIMREQGLDYITTEARRSQRGRKLYFT